MVEDSKANAIKSSILALCPSRQNEMAILCYYSAETLVKKISRKSKNSFCLSLSLSRSCLLISQEKLPIYVLSSIEINNKKVSCYMLQVKTTKLYNALITRARRGTSNKIRLISVLFFSCAAKCTIENVAVFDWAMHNRKHLGVF